MKIMAPIIGPEKTQEILLDRFLEMCSLDHQYVRKSCAEFFPVFCQVLGTDITESLLVRLRKHFRITSCILNKTSIASSVRQFVRG